MRKGLCVIAYALGVTAMACGGGEDPQGNSANPAGDSAAGAATASTPAASGDGPEFMGQTADHWIQQLAEASESDAKVQAVSALTSIGPDVAGVTDALIGALDDEADLVRVGASRTLGRFSADIIPDLVGTLNDHPDAGLRAGVAPVLGNQSADPAANVALQKALLGDADPAVRTAAARGLSVGGEASLPAVSALMMALAEDESADVRQWSAIALGRIGSDASEAIPVLEAAQEDADRNVVSAAGAALRQIRR